MWTNIVIIFVYGQLWHNCMTVLQITEKLPDLAFWWSFVCGHVTCICKCQGAKNSFNLMGNNNRVPEYQGFIHLWASGTRVHTGNMLIGTWVQNFYLSLLYILLHFQPDESCVGAEFQRSSNGVCYISAWNWWRCGSIDCNAGMQRFITQYLIYCLTCVKHHV